MPRRGSFALGVKFEMNNAGGGIKIIIININMIDHHYDLLLVVLGLPLNVDAHHLLLLLPLLLGLLRTTLLAIFTCSKYQNQIIDNIKHCFLWI